MKNGVIFNIEINKIFENLYIQINKIFSEVKIIKLQWEKEKNILINKVIFIVFDLENLE